MQTVLTNCLLQRLVVNNVLPAGLTINSIKTNIYVAGQEDNGAATAVRATVDYTIPGGFTVAGKSQGTSPRVPFTLTRGTLGSLDVLGRDLSTENIIDVT